MELGAELHMSYEHLEQPPHHPPHRHQAEEHVHCQAEESLKQYQYQFLLTAVEDKNFTLTLHSSSKLLLRLCTIDWF